MSRPDSRTAIQANKPGGAPTAQPTEPRAERPGPDLPEDQRDSTGARIWFFLWLGAFTVLAFQAVFDLVSGLFR